MLQTIILLTLLSGVFILGVWMTFFGHRAFRLSGAFFGFGLGMVGMLFAASQFGFSYTSLPVMIGTPVFGLFLGLLGGFVPIVGAGLGGICMGYFYGVGVVDTVDILLKGAIDPLLYTSISVALIAITFILCLIWHEGAKWLTTAFSGSYAAVLTLTLVLMWFTAGGFGSTDPALAGNFLTKIFGLNAMISPTVKMFLLLAAFIIGVLGCVLQVNFKRKRDEFPQLEHIDEPLSDLLILDEDLEEDVSIGRKSKRGLFGKSKQMADDAESDLFDDDQPQPVKERRRGSQTEAYKDEEPIAIPQRKIPPVQVAVVQQAESIAQTSESMDATQVFRRIDGSALPDKKAEQVQTRPTAAPTSSPDQARAPKPSENTVLNEPRLTHAPSFAPRSQRRRGK